MIAKLQLSMTKRTLCWAPTNAKLLAYKTRCLPHPGYAKYVLDPSSRNDISDRTTPGSGSTIHSWYQGRDGVEDARLHKKRGQWLSFLAF